MYKNILILVLVLFLGLPSLAQNSINDYKYVVVPIQFEFLKGKDQYRTSTLTRYLFKKEGFEVYFDEEELPADLFQNRCLGLYADVLKVSSFLNIKTQIELKDCYGNVILLSKEGSTKIKEYHKAYPVAIRKAFESIEFLNYKYNPDSTVGSERQVITKTKPIQENTEEAQKAKVEVQRLKKEVEDLKRQKELAIAKAEFKTKIEDDAKKNKTQAKKIEAKGVVDNNTKELKESKLNITLEVLYAQAIGDGFQLVNAEPKVVMVLLKTAAPNVYTVKGKNAIVFKQDDKWIYSENDGIGKITEELNIKF